MSTTNSITDRLSVVVVPVQGLLEHRLLNLLVEVAHVDGVVHLSNVPHDLIALAGAAPGPTNTLLSVV